VSRRYGPFRWIAGAIVAVSVVAMGVVQLASDALNSGAAAAETLPRHVPHQFGIAVYSALDRIAPAQYVETSLAQAALDRHDADAAERYALRLAASPTRDELLARVALMRGQHLLALEYFLAAPDPDAVNRAAQALAVRDPAAGYALEGLLVARLAGGGTHPDALAQAYWVMGRLANRQAWRQVPGSRLQRAWLRLGLRDFEAAVRLAPLSERYIVTAANQADLLGDRRRAEELFAQGVDVDPASADAVAGLGVVAWENGNRSAANRYLARARSLDAGALMVRALERDLR
jgi:tetratricopeptide (TPR) repeat protein